MADTIQVKGISYRRDVLCGPSGFYRGDAWRVGLREVQNRPAVD